MTGAGFSDRSIRYVRIKDYRIMFMRYTLHFELNTAISYS